MSAFIMKNRNEGRFAGDAATVYAVDQSGSKTYNKNTGAQHALLSVVERRLTFQHTPYMYRTCLIFRFKGLPMGDVE